MYKLLFTFFILFIPMQTASRALYFETNTYTPIDIFEEKRIIDKNELRCLAANIYFESVGEEKEGQLAVAHVTINRVNHDKFPNTICEVVKQRNKKACQFSWYCQSKKREKFYEDISNQVDYKRIHNLARSFLLDYEEYKDPTDGSLFYHADYVKPVWASRMVKSTVIDTHIFYYGAIKY